jgi:PAS domain S-box-containing protein
MHESPSHGGDLFRVAFDLAPSGMFAVDASGRILLANRESERLLGYGPGELVGRTVDDLVPPRARGGHAGYRSGYFANPSARAMGAGRDLSAMRRDGTEVPVEIGLNPVRTPDGVVVIASIVDITARREAERAAREAEERVRQSRKLESLGTLAGGIAHDFNNLLLAIVGFTEMVQRQVPGNAAAQADLEQVLRAADRGRLLVQRILAFSRQRDIARVPVRLERVVGESLALLRASLPSTIEIRSALDAATPLVLADETQVQQVLLNLATNSAHAMKDGGTLDVRVAPARVDEDLARLHPELKPGLHAHLSVADTGTGMPPEVRERIFEPFFTTKPVGEGTGLGLSVILGIVRAFDGAVAVHSEPGHGTRVDVWLPAHRVPHEPTHQPEQPGAPNHGRHVLFVEDEEVLAQLERRQLQSLGYRVTVYTSSLEALEDFRRRPQEFDLLVTDNTMPRLTGLALAAEVTKLRPGLPVLMVSGYAEHADPEVLRASGVSATLRKPHTARELDAALSALFERP